MQLKFSSAKNTQRTAMAFIWASGVLAVIFLLAIIIYVFIKGIPALSWSFLTTPPTGDLHANGGISWLIPSTIYFIALTIGILLVPGIGAGIYMAEYARDTRLTRFIRFGIDLLAGLPSIILGLFGFALLVTALHLGYSIISGALTLAFLLLPTLIRTTEEALKAVPRGHREGALALGATKWQTTSRIVIPTAMPGIITGVILCIGRALGETACLYMTLGFTLNLAPRSIMDPSSTLATYIYSIYGENMGKAMAAAVVLIVAIIVINTVTNWLSHRFQKKMMGRLS